MICIPHLLVLASAVVLFDPDAALCSTDGDEVVACEENLGVGGPDARGDLIELADNGAGLEVAVLRKTRAGGNWLTGGIVVMLCCILVMVSLYGRLDAGMSQLTVDGYYEGL